MKRVKRRLKETPIVLEPDKTCVVIRCLRPMVVLAGEEVVIDVKGLVARVVKIGDDKEHIVVRVEAGRLFRGATFRVWPSEEERA